MTESGNKMYVERVCSDTGYLRHDNRLGLDHLDFELTERCNNNCIHCYINRSMDDESVRKNELPVEKIKEILSESVSLGCLTVRFSGGEPLLHESFDDIYSFCRKQGLKVQLFTNATLITESRADLLKRMPPMEKIEVTLYGMSCQSYEAVSRVPGSFESAMAGIERLRSRRIPFVVKGAVLPSNRHELNDFYNWVKGIEWVEIPPPPAMFFDLRCRHDDEKKNDMIRQLRLSPAEGFNILRHWTPSYENHLRRFCRDFLTSPSDRLFTCGSGWRGGCVGAYGEMQPCLLLKSPATAYDLKNGSLKEGISVIFPEIREMRAVSREYLDTCGKCFLRGMCDQCPAKSWIEHGTLDTPVGYLCEIAHYQARRIGLLKDGEKSWKIGDWEKRMEKIAGDL